MRRKKCLPSYINCGKVYEPYLPDSLDQSEPPIILGEVSVNRKYIENPCVFIKFSEFINFILFGLNPKFKIIYRLVREDVERNNEQILQNWEFEFETPKIIEIANVDTRQPTVLNYCDSLNECSGDRLTYRLEIVEIVTNSVKSYSLTNKSIVATVANKFTRCDYEYIPYISKGKVYNPVLPLSLSKEDKPIALSSVNVFVEENQKVGVLVNFSGFVTSILRDDDFNRLTFRLIKVCNNSFKILREWPFSRAFVNDTNIKEPIVYDYCECLEDEKDIICTYVFQLVEAELSNNSYYDITNKSMTAEVYFGKCEDELC